MTDFPRSKFLKAFTQLQPEAELEKQRAIWQAFGVDYEEKRRRVEREWLRLKARLKESGVQMEGK